LAHPLTLLSMLLKDWVFSQHPKSVSRAVSLLANRAGLKLLLAGGATSGSHGTLLGLPDSCGRADLERELLRLADEGLRPDVGAAISSAIAKPDKESEFIRGLKEPWLSELRSVTTIPQYRQIAWKGRSLGLLECLTNEDALNLQSCWQLGLAGDLFSEGRFDLINSQQELFAAAVDYVLDNAPWPMKASPTRRGKKVKYPLLARFAISLSPTAYFRALRDDAPPVPLVNFAFDHLPFQASEETDDDTEVSKGSEIKSFLREWRTTMDTTAQEWQREGGPWDLVLEAARSRWGERWAIMELANMSGFARRSAKPKASVDLCDSSRPHWENVPVLPVHKPEPPPGGPTNLKLLQRRCSGRSYYCLQ
jgi:hypothetical protein